MLHGCWVFDNSVFALVGAKRCQMNRKKNGSTKNYKTKRGTKTEGVILDERIIYDINRGGFSVEALYKSGWEYRYSIG